MKKIIIIALSYAALTGMILAATVYGLIMWSEETLMFY